eukprot:gene3599-biopygen1465
MHSLRGVKIMYLNPQYSSPSHGDQWTHSVSTAIPAIYGRYGSGNILDADCCTFCLQKSGDDEDHEEEHKEKAITVPVQTFQVFQIMHDYLQRLFVTGIELKTKLPIQCEGTGCFIFSSILAWNTNMMFRNNFS